MTDAAKPIVYRAFLSDSHRDKRAAKRWHKRLEAFPIDRDLIGRAAKLGPVPAKLSPIFWDRLDFPATGGLDALTRDHLDQSAALILLASPRSAASRAVNEEVRYFRHAYPDRPLVVILERGAGVAFQDCLPPALRFALDADGAVSTTPCDTPVAADPRAANEGPPRATAKVVAGLTGLTPDDVLGRVTEALRHERWMWWGAVAGMVALLVVVGGGGWFVLDRIDRQHAEVISQQSVGQQRIEQLVIRMAGDGPAAMQAIKEFRDLLRPDKPDIDDDPIEKLPGFAKNILETLREPATNPADFQGAIRQALEGAQSRINKLQFGDAAKVLDDALARSNDMVRGYAALLAERGKVARLQLDYRGAAGFYAQAAGTVPATDTTLRWRYTLDAADALYDQGNEFGDNQALHDAIAAYQTTVGLAPRDLVPLDWAKTQHNLGVALRTLGQRESGTARLHQAVEAFSLALTERSRDRIPLDWAMTQDNLGFALLRLAERESGTARLDQAAEAFRAVLTERTRDRAPLDWAMTLNNLGLVFWRLGERDGVTTRLDQAVDAYRAALLERTRDRVPLDWAATQNNLGNALATLGAGESGTARLDQAVDAYRAALLEQTRDRVPLDWAMTQNNLGNALATLGEWDSETARLDQAVDAYCAALLERTRDRVPLDWAATQSNLGSALATLGERESGTARLEQAVEAYRAALLERTRDRVPLQWATTQNNLGSALRALGARESGTARLDEAVEAYRAALLELTRDRVLLDWAFSRHTLANALALLAERSGDRGTLEEAISCMRDAAEVYREGNVTYWVPEAERRVREMEAALAAMPR